MTVHRRNRRRVVQWRWCHVCRRPTSHRILVWDSHGVYSFRCGRCGTSIRCEKRGGRICRIR